MLTTLHINNYALIDELNVTFNNGFTIITGETGAGKSILLGGLSLVLGKRADATQVKNSDKKCIIEAGFDITNYNLKDVFKHLDLDYDAHTIIRREILPSGKSRAFINDTPVTLDNLASLSSHLIDIHSQHQTLQVTQDNYQFTVIDALAGNQDVLHTFSHQLLEYKTLQKSIEALKASKSEMLKEYDYNMFLLKELKEINLPTINLEDLELQYEELSNVEVIGEKLSSIKAILSTEQSGISDQVNLVKQALSKIAGFGKSYEVLRDRITSVGIELDDILVELDNLEDNLITEPAQLEHISNTLQIVNSLLQKHGVLKVDELIAITSSLEDKIDVTETLDDAIEKKEKALLKQQEALNTLASKISKKRKTVIPVFISKLEAILSDLGMPNAKFKIELSPLNQFAFNGKDTLQFLFTANKGTSFNALKKAASGGELSRIMLAVKSILAEYVQLPSIMFDEIDTGVSGEISNKMGEIMKQMSSKMQVFSITHLPQIAAKGNTHFKVFKTDIDNKTHTNLKQLNADDRVIEIAQMLGGLNITESAMAHAKQLLN